MGNNTLKLFKVNTYMNDNIYECVYVISSNIENACKLVLDYLEKNNISSKDYEKEIDSIELLGEYDDNVEKMLIDKMLLVDKNNDVSNSNNDNLIEYITIKDIVINNPMNLYKVSVKIYEYDDYFFDSAYVIAKNPDIAYDLYVKYFFENDNIDEKNIKLDSVEFLAGMDNPNKFKKLLLIENVKILSDSDFIVKKEEDDNECNSCSLDCHFWTLYK